MKALEPKIQKAPQTYHCVDNGYLGGKVEGPLYRETPGRQDQDKTSEYPCWLHTTGKNGGLTEAFVGAVPLENAMVDNPPTLFKAPKPKAAGRTYNYSQIEGKEEEEIAGNCPQAV